MSLGGKERNSILVPHSASNLYEELCIHQYERWVLFSTGRLIAGVSLGARTRMMGINRLRQAEECYNGRKHSLRRKERDRKSHCSCAAAGFLFIASTSLSAISYRRSPPCIGRILKCTTGKNP